VTPGYLCRAAVVAATGANSSKDRWGRHRGVMYIMYNMPNMFSQALRGLRRISLRKWIPAPAVEATLYLAGGPGAWEAAIW